VYSMYRIRVSRVEPQPTCYGTRCWEPGGCNSGRTIVRLNVDIGVVGCFPWFSSVLLSTSISPRVTFTKYHVVRKPSLPTSTVRVTGQLKSIRLQHVVPLLPFVSRQVWAYLPDSVGVASSSGEICHPPTPIKSRVRLLIITAIMQCGRYQREFACKSYSEPLRIAGQ
jgi:hypothetical protein